MDINSMDLQMSEIEDNLESNDAPKFDFKIIFKNYLKTLLRNAFVLRREHKEYFREGKGAKLQEKIISCK